MIAAIHTLGSGSAQPQEQPSAQQQEPWRNVGNLERWLSLLGGGTLAVFGLTRGTWGGLALGLVGGAMVYRGLTGHCSVYSSLGISTAEAPQDSLAGTSAEPDTRPTEAGQTSTRF